MTISADDLETRFTYHPPSEAKVITHMMIRKHGQSFAEFINEEVPDSREKSLAITKIEEAVMWANAALARSTED